MKTELEYLRESVESHKKINKYLIVSTKQKINEIGIKNFPLDFLEFFKDLEEKNHLFTGVLTEKQDNSFFDDEENVEYLSRKVEIFIFIACIFVLFIFYCLLF